MNNNIYLFLGAVFLGGCLLWIVPQEKTNFAGLPNMNARIARLSSVATGPEEIKTLFTAKDNCASRVVTTVADPIMISFDSSATPTGTSGHLQSASTTVAYESDVYGCGAVTAYGFASSTITVSDISF